MIIDDIAEDTPGLPVIETIRSYNFSLFHKDAIAGLTVAMIAVPQCMAYALIAGLDPIFGLYAGMFGAIAGSFFGSSHHLITGPAAVIALFVGTILVRLSEFPTLDVLVALSVLVGVFQIIFAFLKLGDLARFVSVSVISGFLSGSAVVIIGDQLPTFLGIPSSSSPYFFKRFTVLIANIYMSEEFHVFAMVLGISSIVLVVIFRLINEKLPSILLSVGILTACSYFFDFSRYAVELVGEIPTGFPRPVLPPADISLFSQVFGGALALNLLASVQSISVSKSIASQTMQSTDDNQELLGQGIANIFCGIFRGFPASASLTRSFLNYRVGAKTRLSGIFSGIGIGLSIALLAPFIYYIPLPVLAGIIIVIGYDIFDWKQIKISLFTTRRDQIAFVSTFLFVLLLELDTAIFAGVITSVVLYLRKAIHVDMKEYAVDENGELKHIENVDERHHPKVALIDISGETFFGSADLIKERINEVCAKSPDIKVVILRMKNAMNLDITSALMLKQIANMLTEEGRTLMLSGATPHVQEILEESGVADFIGRDKILVAQKNLLKSTRQALDRADTHIDDVLEGEESREEETPPLKYTMRGKRREGEDKEEEDPIEEEKTGPLTEYDEKG